MPNRYKLRLLSHLKHDSYTPRPMKALAADLNIDSEDRKAFEAEVYELLEEGAVVMEGDMTIDLPPLEEEVVGVIRMNPRGFGFLRPDDANAHGDLFIPPGSTLDALSGDKVRAAVYHKKGRPHSDHSPFIGEVVEVIERGQHHFTGTLFKRGGSWFIEPDGKVLHEAILVRDPSSKNAKADDKVVFELLHAPEGNTVGEGVIVEVLGDAGEPDVETLAVIRAYGLGEEFDKEILQQARQVTRDFDERLEEALAREKRGEEAFPDREDLRKAFICTIDPPDAKDYDDAISIQRVKDGFELGVHIADVATFIDPGSPLDEEAKLRGNSVYLPRLVIPMLPELLSNGICSLQEAVPRFAKSAFITYDADGHVRGARVANTVIQSVKRMTYLEAQALIDGKPEEARKHAKTDAPHTGKLTETVRLMNDLARRIRKRREAKGMISLDLPDAELVFNDEGRVIDVEPEDDAYTHTIIEMFMVEANEAVARLFDSMNVHIIRRLHPDPDPGDMDEMREFIQVAGLKLSKNPDRFELQSILNATRGTGRAAAVHMAVLRTLTQATYGPDLVGHFALASDHYAHFTSPIRRYPDLTVHRALAAFLERTDNGKAVPKKGEAKRNLGKELAQDKRCMPLPELQRWASHCSTTSRNAEDAERDLRSFLILQFLEDHIGETFEGLVTGVTPKMVFVRLDKYLAEGAILVSKLTDKQGRPDFHRFDKKSGKVYSAKSGSTIGLGDRVQVVIEEVDPSKRRMDLLLDTGKRGGQAKRGTIKAALTQGGGGLEAKKTGGKPAGWPAPPPKKKKKKRKKSDVSLRDQRQERKKRK